MSKEIAFDPYDHLTEAEIAFRNLNRLKLPNQDSSLNIDPIIDWLSIDPTIMIRIIAESKLEEVDLPGNKKCKIQYLAPRVVSTTEKWSFLSRQDLLMPSSMFIFPVENANQTEMTFIKVMNDYLNFFLVSEKKFKFKKQHGLTENLTFIQMLDNYSDLNRLSWYGAFINNSVEVTSLDNALLKTDYLLKVEALKRFNKLSDSLDSFYKLVLSIIGQNLYSPSDFRELKEISKNFKTLNLATAALFYDRYILDPYRNLNKSKVLGV